MEVAAVALVARLAGTTDTRLNFGKEILVKERIWNINL
jgi:hypothetical protein